MQVTNIRLGIAGFAPAWQIPLSAAARSSLASARDPVPARTGNVPIQMPGTCI